MTDLPTLADQRAAGLTPDQLLRAIAVQKQHGDDPAELYALRIQLLRALHCTPHRVCVRCGLPRPLADYQGQRGRICLACRTERERAYGRHYSATYHAQHGDAQRAAMRANYQAKKAAYRARSRAWLKANYARHLELKRAWRARNRDAINAARRARAASPAGRDG